MFVQLKKDYFGNKAGARIDVDEPVANALIQQGIAEALQADPFAPLLAKAMEGMLGSLNQALATSIDQALKQFADAQTKSRKNQLPAIFGDNNSGGDPKKTLGAFLLAVRLGDQKALEEMGSKFVEWDTKSTMVTQTGSLGGYLVPDEQYASLMQLVTEMSVVWDRAFKIRQGGRTTKINMLDSATAPSAGHTATLGGMTMAWTEEAAQITADSPVFQQAELTNYELCGYVPVSNTLSEDWGGLEDFLHQLFAKGISWYIDYAFLRGTGAGQPQGILNWPGFISVDRSAASAFALSDYANVLARWLPNWNTSAACWACHPTVLAKLLQMQAPGAGGSTLFVDNARERPQYILGGLPLEVTEKLPSLNTAGDIILADFSKYVIGDRKQIEVAFSPHFIFNKNQTAWRVVSRVAGMPWMSNKLTLADGSNTLSPFVGVAAG
jgi:HK97 family phage major capsid protein